MRRSILLASLVFVISTSISTHSTFVYAQTAKPKLTLDEFFNSVSFTAVKVSPDGNSVVIATEKADWEHTEGMGVILTDQPGENAWPITSPTFILVHKKATPDVLEALKFFDWAFRYGGAAAEALDYVPLPKLVADLAADQWAPIVKLNKASN